VSRARLVALGAVVLLLASLAGAVGVRAQSANTGRSVALGLPERCPDLAKLSFLRRPGAGVIGRWVTVDGPKFTPERETFGARPAIAAHSIDPANPSVQLVSDGSEIHRTSDGGCSWTETHQITETLTVTENNEVLVGERIRQLEQVGAAKGARRAWALLAPQPDGVGAIRVLVSDNAGVDWEERSSGLPVGHSRYDSDLVTCAEGPCSVSRMAVSPSDPDVAYLVINRQLSSDFYRTADAGRTWIRLLNPVNASSRGYAGFEVSPLDPAHVWAISQGRLMSSQDGGATWKGHVDRLVGGLHLGVVGGRLSVQVMEETVRLRYGGLQRSIDGGATFTRIELSDAFGGYPLIAQGGDPDGLIATTDDADTVRRFDPATRGFESLAVDGLGDVNAPRLDRTGDPVVWFRQFADISVFVPGAIPADELPPRPVVPRPDFAGRAGATLESAQVPGVLTPVELARDLGAEGSLDQSYRLELPALPTPVDIYFLMDTSGSMGGAHEGLRKGIRLIIDELGKAGIDAWYGLGVFPAREIFYDRRADLAPPGEDLYAALETLTTDGRNNEIHPTALYQSVTGEGQENAEIPPGRGASFRANALKIIVHATDETYGDDPTGPSREDAAEALAAAGVRHVGLDLAPGATTPGPAGAALSVTKPDHDFMARETGTFAPPEGIDCNGDGTIELKAGDPVTCPLNRYLDSLVVGPAIVAAVKGVRDETAVALEVADSGGVEVRIDQPVVSPVNLKLANSIPFGVSFTCPPEMTGRVADVVLQATVRGARSGSARARIGCGAAVAPVKAAPRPLAAAVPLILAPPQVVPNIEPGVSPLQQPAPSQVAAPNVQPGVAAQPGEMQTAKQRAGRGNSPVPPPDSGRGEAPAAAAGTLAAGAALATGAGAWATRRQRATSPARRRA